MARIEHSKDCGNSPKQLFAEAFTIALLCGDLDFLADTITDEIRWELAGQETIAGKEDFCKTVDEQPVLTELSIDNVVTHGRKGAVNGRLRRENYQEQNFCCVYVFGNAKGTIVDAIITYWAGA